jgi:hypothetical protein
MTTRRRFLAIATGALALAAPAVARATPRGGVGMGRLWVIRAFDGETLDAPIRLRTPDATRRAWMLWSHFWRDVKDGDQAVWIDSNLLDRMSGVQVEMSRQRHEEVPLLLISGYRTRERNARIEGAAPNSQHCLGRAADFTGRGFTPRQTADIIEGHPSWGSGGLGRYSDFTHMDTGTRRRWGRN